MQGHGCARLRTAQSRRCDRQEPRPQLGSPTALCKPGLGHHQWLLLWVLEFAMKYPDLLESFYSSEGSWLELQVGHA